VIDLHFHLLPGIDDGPPDLEASVALARAAADTGTETIVATPHVGWDWPNSASTISDSVDRVATRLAELAIPIRVVAGAEIALARANELPDEELRRLSLGGGPWLLIELPQRSSVLGLESQLLHLQKRGHQIVLAHVERCPTFLQDLRVLEHLEDAGILASLTAGALVGRFGKTLQRFGRELVKNGLVSNVASDAHDLVRRPPGVARELSDSGLGAQAQWLTRDMPQAILAGDTMPPAPDWPSLAAPPRRVKWLRR
jgi:protein-tyrosine phosphatase